MQNSEPSNPDSEVVQALHAALAKHAPVRARDGDCEPTADKVARVLRAQGRAAEIAVLAGWQDMTAMPFSVPEGVRVLAWYHHCTLLDGWVADGTATQFNPALPAAWVAPLSDYLNDLATAAPGVAAVSIEDRYEPDADGPEDIGPVNARR
ncbi:hypothetical protein [Nocardia sp. NPDC050435]|uniref:hypothetical protein n=1 Tax=Nocardia sp. NPDC050435 TaxID=3155040 RepID=UPI0033F9FD47